MPARSQVPQSTATPERTSAVAWWVAILMLFYCILSVADRTIITMLVAPIQKDLGLTDFQVSLALGPAFALSYAIATLPLGWAADRFPRRWVVMLGVLGWSLATAGSGLARSFLGLFGCRVGVGMGEAALMPAAYSLIAEKFPKRRLTTAMAILGTGPKLGASAAFAIGGAMFAMAPASGRIAVPVVGEIAVWQAVFLLLGLAGILTAPLCFSFSELRRTAPARVKGAPGGLTAFLKVRWTPVMPIIFGFSLVALGAAALTAWVPTYMVRTYGWGPAQYGPILSIITLCTATTVVLKGLLVDWLFGRGMLDAHIRFYTWLLAAAIPIMIAAFIVGQPLWFLILYGLANVAAMTFMVYLSSILQLIVPNELRGQVNGLSMLFVTTLSAGVAPTLVASITDFVFHDQAALGRSLAIVVLTSFSLALILLRWVMKPVAQILGNVEDTSNIGKAPIDAVTAQP